MAKKKIRSSRELVKTPIVDKDQFEFLRAILKKRTVMPIEIVTGSMVPLISVGEVIQVAPLNKTPKRFDIIVFWNKKILVCHYIWHCNSLEVQSGKQTFVTRGLVNPHEDIPCDEERILGRVISHKIPKSMRVKQWFKTFLGRQR